MCGIAGLYAFSSASNRQDLHNIALQMTTALAHRGPDSYDLWQDPNVPLILGHRRLAIIDLTEEGRQPMISASGRYVISYNGEIYNYLDIKSELRTQNFRGNSDTEVLLAAIEEWGIESTLQKIIGMFAIILWDKKEKKLHFLRDPFGKKPLYIGWAGKNLLFGSELKSLAAHPEFQREIDPDALCAYLRYAYLPAPHCIYREVINLPPSGILSLEMEKLRPGTSLQPMVKTYWDPVHALEKSRATQIKSQETALSEFEKILKQCVSQRMISDVPLGAFLSGGIDSSLIVGIMQSLSIKPVKTYTIGFNEKGFNEAQYAKKVAAHLGTDHHELYLNGSDALKIVPGLQDIYDEPFADMSQIPTFLVSRFATDQVTVALSGDGGDEMLGGYMRHISGPQIWAVIRNIPLPMRLPISYILEKIPPALWEKIRPQSAAQARKLAESLSSRNISEIYTAWSSQFTKPETLVPWGREPKICLPIVENLTFAESMMLWDVMTYLPGDILTKVDRASMAVGLEARAPFLDLRMYEFVWRLPMEYKIRNGKGKILARQLLKKYIPENLYERPKQGFSVPIAQWLRGPLKDWAEDLLDENKLKGEGDLNPRIVRELWKQHNNGAADHARRLWIILMFQDWRRRWL